MRRLIRYVALLSVVALLSPAYGFAEQPPGRIAAAAGAQSTVAWAARAPHIPRMPARPSEIVPTIEARGEEPRDLSVERPVSSEIKQGDGVDIKASVDEGAFLLPTWNRGFWVMPPGGLTRFLMPPPGFINPEETLPPVSYGASSG